jgi:hypothetical protein
LERELQLPVKGGVLRNRDAVLSQTPIGVVIEA